MKNPKYTQDFVLRGFLDVTPRNYRIFEKSNPLEDLSCLEVLVIRHCLNAMSVDDVVGFLENNYGRTDDRVIKSLLSIAVLYGADKFVMDLVYHPLFEFKVEYIDSFAGMALGLMRQGEANCARSLVGYLVGIFPFNLRLKALQLRLAFEGGSEEVVEQLFSRLTMQDFMMEPGLASVRIDFLCEKNRLDQAGELIAFYTGFCYLPSCLLSSIIYYYIEKDDLAAGRKLLKHLLCSEFCYHAHMQTVVRVIDDENGAQEVVGYIEDVEGWYRYPDLMACREAVSYLYQKKNQNLLLASAAGLNANSSSKLESAKSVVLFCVDKSYRVPALVAIFGVMREVDKTAEKPKIALFVPETEMPFWKVISEQLAKFSGWSEFLLIHENMPEISKCRERYGCHTLRTLSSMAYGRLFAVKMLCGLSFEKLLYLDADIAVVNDLMPIFSVDQLGFPVSGIVDRPVDKVVQAMEIHGISNKKYMNSGVMLFDLKHPATEVLLQKAIDYVLDPDVELIFHDQCAINKALKGNFHPLPVKYNLFVPPGSITHRKSESVVLHFVDAPKPWQVAHLGGSGVDIWREQFSLAQADLKKIGIPDLECVSDELVLV